MRSLLDKKGQLGNLQAIITTLIIVGILIGIAFLILEEFKNNLDNETATVVNETVTTVGGIHAPGLVATRTTNCFGSFVPISIVNSSHAAFNATYNLTQVGINGGNYSYNSNGTIWYTGAGNPYGFNNSNWNVTYSYTYGLEGCGGLETTIDATTTITDWLPIIVILAIVGILLAIVFLVLPSSGGGSSGGGGSFRGFGRGSSSTAEI